jgi:hypothetical protein
VALLNQPIYQFFAAITRAVQSVVLSMFPTVDLINRLSIWWTPTNQWLMFGGLCSFCHSARVLTVAFFISIVSYLLVTLDIP